MPVKRSASAEPVRSEPPTIYSERMPIEEVARRTAMTVRNVRALQACGLLEPPELKGRKGFYTDRHVARVGLVRRLQGQGFSLAAIGRLLERWHAGAGLMEVAGFEDALLTPGSVGQRGEADVATTFPQLLADRRALAKALKVELVVRRDGRVIAPNAELLAIVMEEVRAGVPLDAVLDEGLLLFADMERIAERFRRTFYKHVVEAFIRRGSPAAELSALAETVTRLRPLSVRSATIMLSQAMERGVTTLDQAQATAKGTPSKVGEGRKTKRTRKPTKTHPRRSKQR